MITQAIKYEVTDPVYGVRYISTHIKHETFNMAQDEQRARWRYTVGAISGSHFRDGIEDSGYTGVFLGTVVDEQRFHDLKWRQIGELGPEGTVGTHFVGETNDLNRLHGFVPPEPMKREYARKLKEHADKGSQLSPDDKLYREELEKYENQQLAGVDTPAQFEVHIKAVRTKALRAGARMFTRNFLNSTFKIGTVFQKTSYSIRTPKQFRKKGEYYTSLQHLTTDHYQVTRVITSSSPDPRVEAMCIDLATGRIRGGITTFRIQDLYEVHVLTELEVKAAEQATWAAINGAAKTKWDRSNKSSFRAFHTGLNRAEDMLLTRTEGADGKTLLNQLAWSVFTTKTAPGWNGQLGHEQMCAYLNGVSLKLDTINDR